MDEIFVRIILQKREFFLIISMVLYQQVIKSGTSLPEGRYRLVCGKG